MQFDNFHHKQNNLAGGTFDGGQRNQAAADQTNTYDEDDEFWYGQTAETGLIR